MSRPKVYLVEYLHPTAMQTLEAHAEIVSDPMVADAAINRNLRMDRAWLEKCPNLKVIGIHGTGTDGVDLPAAKERGIRVIYAPGENAASVAELIVTFALVLSRHVHTYDRILHSDNPSTYTAGALVGSELRGKTFGMIGCGKIALLAAGILRDGFGMSVIGCSRSLTPEKAEAQKIGFCASPAEVFAGADIISIGVPLNDSTRNLVDADVLACAKKNCILINTARGGIVREAALFEALHNHTVAAAACDVFELEPPTRDNPLLSLPNFLATPHIGANTDEALYRVSNSTVNQVLAVLAGEDNDSIRWVVK